MYAVSKQMHLDLTMGSNSVNFTYAYTMYLDLNPECLGDQQSL